MADRPQVRPLWCALLWWLSGLSGLRGETHATPAISHPLWSFIRSSCKMCMATRTYNCRCQLPSSTAPPRGGCGAAEGSGAPRQPAGPACLDRPAASSSCEASRQRQRRRIAPVSRASPGAVSPWRCGPHLSRKRRLQSQRRLSRARGLASCTAPAAARRRTARRRDAAGSKAQGVCFCGARSATRSAEGKEREGAPVTPPLTPLRPAHEPGDPAGGMASVG